MTIYSDDNDTTIEVPCPCCLYKQLEIVDVTAAFCYPLPEIFRVKCQNCDFNGEAYEDRIDQWCIVEDDDEDVVDAFVVDEKPLPLEFKNPFPKKTIILI